MARRTLGWATLAGGVLVLVFWITYFTGAAQFAQEHGLFGAFESAFLLADALLASALFAASHALFTGRARGPFLLVVAGSMCVYLGILDVTFYARQGFYWPLSGAALIELVVNALTIGGGAFGLRAAWALWGRG